MLQVNRKEKWEGKRGENQKKEVGEGTFLCSKVLFPPRQRESVVDEETTDNWRLYFYD